MIVMSKSKTNNESNDRKILSEVSIVVEKTGMDKKEYYSISLKSNIESMKDLIKQAKQVVPQSTEKIKQNLKQEWIK